ncbi:MAG TPA: DNA gyrase modulator, partial [Verrucomicrobiota bacterium]|nr:DNA gyrase modulator [Verrucomicrobiota bacterium]
MKTPSDPVFPFVASRRQFIKVTGLAVGAIALPAWDCESAQAGLSLSEKHDLADIAVSTARRLGASYADIRINRYRAESITTRERQVQNVSRNENFGFGVRVLVKGTWGFAASNNVTAREVRRVTR